MTTDPHVLASQCIHDLARLRAQQLRAEAIQAFWSGMAQAVQRRLRRSAFVAPAHRRTVEV